MSTELSVQTLPANAIARYLGWFSRQGYLQGVFWIMLVALTSNTNDILMRLAGQNIPPLEITFFRYFFAVLTLLPVMLYNRKVAFATQRPGLHIIRSFLLFGAIACWSTAVTLVPLAVVSTLALTVPLFVLPMASFFLKETIGWQRTVATLAGFSGIFLVVYDNSSESFWNDLWALNNGTIFLIIAAIFFALSDIINKKFVSKESDLSMLFYIALGTTLIAFIPAYHHWIQPTLQECLYFFFLGAGSNLILYFLLRAFSSTDISALAPYRYTELIFATFFGYTFFAELPNQWFWIGATIIVISTAAISSYELQQQKKT
jgi:S-adenosylmethionine uptake transporter